MARHLTNMVHSKDMGAAVYLGGQSTFLPKMKPNAIC